MRIQPMVEVLNPRLAAVLAVAVREGRHLEVVSIHDFRISAQGMAALATGLATAGQADGLPELHFMNCPFIGRAESGGLMGAPEYLAAGLASNATLKKLCLVGAEFDDASLASIVGALSNHPTLEALELWRCEYGRSTIESIHRWLRMDGCRLRKLEMDGGYASDDQSERNSVLVQLFVQDLPQNTSLESLSILGHRNINESDFNLLLGSMGKFPNLRSLDISSNRIAVSDFVSLANLAKDTMLAPRLRCLDLSYNRYMDNLYGRIVQQHKDGDDSILKSILQLLEAFPELGFLGEDFEQKVPIDILRSNVMQRLDRNRCFGLLQRGATIPLSVWPLVISKANEDPYDKPIDPSRKATILYEMLQGPVFGGRGSF